MKLSELLSKVFSDFSEQVAVVDGARLLTYGQLDRSVDAMASTLSCHNWHVIPFMLESRLDAIVVMLAADRLGIPFMPIDATKTSDAIKNQLKLVQENRYISNVYADFKSISIDSYAVDVSGEPIEQLDNQQVLSLMFTSGSTGMPKGVLVQPDSVINLLHKPSFFELRDSDVFATYSPLAFDASTFEIFGALLNGNKLVILDKLEVADPVLLNKNIERYGITCMWFTAGLFNSLVKADQYSSLGNLRTLFVGGDRVDPDCAVQFLESGFNCELYNGYGPTENTVFTTVARLDADTIREEKSTPIGLAVRNVDVRLMDKDGSWIDGDGEGRLYVKGAGLSLGYLNNEEANSKAFVSLGSPIEERYYDTGDKVLRKSGVHYFVGRYDRQVKVKGQRVDLNLVEDKLKELSGHENLVIYLSKATGGVIAASNRDSDDLNASIKKLSDVEQPRAVVVLSDWPLNENGKVDVKTIILLSESQLLERNEKTPVKSNNDNGLSLQLIVGEITGNDDVSLQDNLFDTGLDSISVVRFQSEIEKRFGVNIGLLDIYEAGNLLNLEQHIASKTSMDERDYYLKQTANTTPGQYAHYFKDLPLNVEQIFRISRNIVEHHAGLNSEHIPLERYVEMEIDKVEDILSILAGNGVESILDPIPLEKKVIGNCFNISKVAVSMLRHLGIPSRIRYAYCTYFYADFSHEQALVEYWDAQSKIWRRGDASMNHEIMKHLEIDIDIDLLNVDKSLSMPISDVWIACRSGDMDFGDFGASVENRKRGGVGHVAHKLTHDLACLNQIELMACDFIAPPANYLRNKNLNLEAFDRVAELLHEESIEQLNYWKSDLPFCVKPRRILRKSRFTGVNVIERINYGN